MTGFLKSAEQQGAIEVWKDDRIFGGAEWRQEIKRKLNGCDIFVLLISHNSLASGFVVDEEIAVIRERQKKGDDVHFYPLLLTPTPRVALDIVNDKNRRPRGGKSFFDYPLNERYRHMSDAVDEIVSLAESIAARTDQPSEQASPPDPAVSPPASTSTQATLPPPPSAVPPSPKMIRRRDGLLALTVAALLVAAPAGLYWRNSQVRVEKAAMARRWISLSNEIFADLPATIPSLEQPIFTPDMSEATKRQLSQQANNRSLRASDDARNAMSTHYSGPLAEAKLEMKDNGVTIPDELGIPIVNSFGWQAWAEKLGGEGRRILTQLGEQE